MKKFLSLIFAAALCVILFSFSSCGKKLLEMPEDTNLEFWVTYDVADFDFSSYERADSAAAALAYYGKGYVPVKNEDGTVTPPDIYVKYRVTPWPTFASGGTYVTGITWNDPEITLYGLTVNSTIDEIEDTLTDAGYEVSRLELNSHASCVAKKDGATISFNDNDGERTFTVTVNVVNYNVNQSPGV